MGFYSLIFIFSFRGVFGFWVLGAEAKLEYDIVGYKPGDDGYWVRGEHHVHRLRVHQARLCSDSP